MTARSLPLLCILLFAASAFAGERIVRQGDDEVHVFDSPCVSAETISRIPEKQREGWGKVQGIFQGQRFFGCWRSMGEVVFILWDDGDQGVIQNSEFRPVTEV